MSLLDWLTIAITCFIGAAAPGPSLLIILYLSSTKGLYPSIMTALGHGIGRIGCLLVGDDYGTPTNLPWGISFPNGSPPSSAYYISQSGYQLPLDIMPSEILSVHPTQIYEMIAYFCIFFFLRSMSKRKHFTGEVFMNYLFLGGLSRFFVEFIRLNPKYYFDLSGAQYISLMMIFIASCYHYYQRKLKDHGIH